MLRKSWNQNATCRAIAVENIVNLFLQQLNFSLQNSRTETRGPQTEAVSPK